MFRMMAETEFDPAPDFSAVRVAVSAGAALPAAVLSLAVILPWWNTVPLGAKMGAAFDLLVLVVLLTPLKERILALVL